MNLLQCMMILGIMWIPVSSSSTVHLSIENERLSVENERLSIENERVALDMTQNNPGDAFAWQVSKYNDPEYIVSTLNFTGRVWTGESSGTLAIDYASAVDNVFPDDSPSRAWIESLRTSLKRRLQRAESVGSKVYFFVDLLVFPKALLQKVPEMTKNGDGVTVEWNDITKKYLNVMVNETFEMFPEVDGWIIREGETYVYDTPYHIGNSPSNNTMSLWIDFIRTVRDFVCVQNGRKLFVRSWDNWPSDKEYYLNMTSLIEPHKLLYFSIKHSAQDFVRPAKWNPMLGVGNHAQIVEVELQREYESKGAIPNYVMDGIIDGFEEMGKDKIGLSSILNSTQIRGLWTWSRGGGWWGPYLHGREIFVDLHAHVLSRWWNESGRRSEEEIFFEIIPELFDGCDSTECVRAFRQVAQMSSDMVLHGQWGTTPYCSTWMRDDRMGGLDQLGCLNQLSDNTTLWEQSEDEKTHAYNTSLEIATLFDEKIRPHLTDHDMIETLWASCEYAKLLYGIIDTSWPLLRQAYCMQHNYPLPMKSNVTIEQALNRYDAAWSAYRAFGLANKYAASLYHPYYLCLGTTCNGAFDPPDTDMQSGSINGRNAYGLGQSIDSVRLS